MPSNYRKPQWRLEEPRLYDAVLDEFLSWIQGDHDEWHRRMEKLHKDVEQGHRATRDRGR